MKSFDSFIYFLSGNEKKRVGSRYKLKGARRSSARFKDLRLQGNYLINDTCKYNIDISHSIVCTDERIKII